MKRYRFSLKDCNVTYTEHIFTVQVYSNCASVVHVGVCVCVYVRVRHVKPIRSTSPGVGSCQNKNMNFGSTKF